VAFLQDVCLHILADFDHQDSIITLSSQGSVSRRQIVTELIDSEVTLATAALSANRGHSLKVPAIHRLVDAAETEYFVLMALWVLEDVLAHHVEESEGHRSGK